MSKTRLQELSEHGQSVWLDYLSRDILESGKLAEMMDRDAVVGVTSNPTIFQKALAVRRRVRRAAQASCSSTRTTRRRSSSRSRPRT